MTYSSRHALRQFLASESIRSASSECPNILPMHAASAAERYKYAVATDPCSRLSDSTMSVPGSSHSPQWKPPSQRNASCSAASGLSASRLGCRRVRAISAA